MKLQLETNIVGDGCPKCTRREGGCYLSGDDILEMRENIFVYRIGDGQGGGILDGWKRKSGSKVVEAGVNKGSDCVYIKNGKRVR